MIDRRRSVPLVDPPHEMTILMMSVSVFKPSVQCSAVGSTHDGRASLSQIGHGSDGIRAAYLHIPRARVSLHRACIIHLLARNAGSDSKRFGFSKFGLPCTRNAIRIVRMGIDLTPRRTWANVSSCGGVGAHRHDSRADAAADAPTSMHESYGSDIIFEPDPIPVTNPRRPSAVADTPRLCTDPCAPSPLPRRHRSAHPPGGQPYRPARRGGTILRRG